MINKQEYIANYFNLLSRIMDSLDRKAIEQFMELVQQIRNDGKTLFIAGNGGSAATASHMANDFGAVCLKKGGMPIKALALTDNTSFFTAIGNDYGYEDIFSSQLDVHYNTGDALVVISASGNSPNVVKAAQWVRNRGGDVVGFLGFDGGALKDICTLPIVALAEKGQYGPVEDVHMILDHLVSSWLLEMVCD